MSSNIHDQSPITLAQSLTPWWMALIKDFDGLEIQPCQIIGYTVRGREIAEPCQPEEASFWTVYGHYRPNGPAVGGVEAFEDFDTEAEAHKFYDRLIGIYPHLIGDPLRHKSSLPSPSP